MTNTDTPTQVSMTQNYFWMAIKLMTAPGWSSLFHVFCDEFFAQIWGLGPPHQLKAQVQRILLGEVWISFRIVLLYSRWMAVFLTEHNLNYRFNQLSAFVTNKARFKYTSYELLHLSDQLLFVIYNCLHTNISR